MCFFGRHLFYPLPFPTSTSLGSRHRSSSPSIVCSSFRRFFCIVSVCIIRTSFRFILFDRNSIPLASNSCRNFASFPLPISARKHQIRLPLVHQPHRKPLLALTWPRHASCPALQKMEAVSRFIRRKVEATAPLFLSLRRGTERSSDIRWNRSLSNNQCQSTCERVLQEAFRTNGRVLCRSMPLLVIRHP